MNPLEITLIILGVILIAISCRLVDRSQNTAKQPADRILPIENSFTDGELKQIKDKIKELLAEVSEETVVRTDDNLSKISNETIMSVSEFSDQVLEKIKRNHEEVVFLYNMLGDKEKELKAVVREIDVSKKKVQDIMDVKKNTLKTPPSKKTDETQLTLQAPQNTKPVNPDNQPKELANDTSSVTQSSLDSNNNTQILSLYSQGKSVVEISRFLGLGQGEVKLVIDLFRGKK